MLRVKDRETVASRLQAKLAPLVAEVSARSRMLAEHPNPKAMYMTLLEFLHSEIRASVPLLLELPRKMDEVLTLATESSARMQLQVRETAEHRRHRNSTASVAALLLVLAGVALLTRYLAVTDELGSKGVKIGAGLLLMVGVLLLVRLSSGR